MISLARRDPAAMGIGFLTARTYSLVGQGYAGLEQRGRSETTSWPSSVQPTT
jgi:hypothetical protein